MWQSLKPFFEWNDKSWLGQAIADTIWAFPVIETIHILALTMMFGAIVIIDLRMMGFGMKKQPVAVLATRQMVQRRPFSAVKRRGRWESAAVSHSTVSSPLRMPWT